ncbi:MAG: SUMF1/EgtB/PvdO family nonheme iron enzyme [Deltaproteobacteria bacterium]|nr:SUMF1/EgtB/PvdO family nonheme iron enzyme [Deltaproteobacteria bacterium]MBW2534063.1 SUMF1/EgtB/PvdO family nonheme iron enzyme [Deltaproteobacteria bacterium]
MELSPDVVIAGKLRLLRPLGQGGMGVVWTARHLSLGTDVAVKFIRPERVAADPTIVARFEREARMAARIAHPHVVQVMDFGAADGIPYMVMELLQGASLAQLLERGGRLSFATAKSLVRQVGGALESAHEQGVIHRDIKPHNVFITEGSKGYPLFVKVLDFGVAKLLGDAAVPDASGALTETGMLLGSPPYMSPEQLEGSKDVDLRSDLWSLGVIIYEALTGRRPFEGSSYVGVGAAVLQGKYPLASELRAGLPPTIDDWFAKVLCLEPEGRFASAREMVDAFVSQPFGGGEPVVVLRDPGDEEAPPEFATTMPAPVAREDAEPQAVSLEPTADHAPALAKRPAAVPQRGRRRRMAWAAAAALAVVVGVGVATSMGSSSMGSCPPGMALINGGTFQMGSAEGADTPTDETPRHAEAVEPFCLDLTEVTVKAYAGCDSCPAAPREVEFEGLTPNGRAFLSQFCNAAKQIDHPINCIDWYQAQAYCSAQGKRLPTEQEWELAARGTEGRLYPWGDAAPAAGRLNACGGECSRMLTERLEKIGKGPWPAMYPEDDAAPTTAPAGSIPAGATPAGVLDLAGNVWEWTASPYCPFGNPDCGDSRRVLRGGGWDTVERSDVRAARRYPSAPSARARSVGFRCAQSP